MQYSESLLGYRTRFLWSHEMVQNQLLFIPRWEWGWGTDTTLPLVSGAMISFVAVFNAAWSERKLIFSQSGWFFFDLDVIILEAVAEVGFESGSAALMKRNHFFMLGDKWHSTNMNGHWQQRCPQTQTLTFVFRNYFKTTIKVGDTEPKRFLSANQGAGQYRP